jgi:hypothetical protein
MVLHEGTVLLLPSYEVALEALMPPGAASQVRLAKVIGDSAGPGADRGA